MRENAANAFGRLLLLIAIGAIVALLLLPGCDEGTQSDWLPTDQLARRY